MCCLVMTQPIYLDYQATTPTDPRALEVMLPYFTEQFANPHSVEHALGRAMEERVDAARAEVAALIGAEAREVVFTSGATEANNMAVFDKGNSYAIGEKSGVKTPISEESGVFYMDARVPNRR